MSLKSVSLSNAVINQYKYKLKAYSGIFTSLVIIQLLGMFFSLNGMGSSGYSTESYSMNITSYSSNLVIVFTMVWAFMNALLVTTRAYREDDFTFVTNRLTYSLSNYAILLTASIIGGVTAFLSSSLINVIAYLTNNIEVFVTINQEIGFMDYVVGVLATILFILLCGALGYFIGMVVQLSKIFMMIIPVCFIAFSVPIQRNGENVFFKLFEFYFQEHSFPLFLLKVLVTIFILSLTAVMMSNRLEVRK
ncbi:hypothetical protein [Ornithinibacillus xuwenensis]|jgi:hypothetical protein|uniref:ABC transporter permease n=1 Tax=Ornithinibacillus xuwenensis TaxID=3144668 RepID=A0ABU9XL17_9BACI